METIQTPSETGEQHNNHVIKETSKEFLISEYYRLVEYQKLTIEAYDRWFSIYIAVVTGIVVLMVSFSQSTTLVTLSDIVSFVHGGLVILGVINFIGLSFANTNSIQYERAIRLIQDAFIKEDPSLNDYLYFRLNKVGVPGLGFKALLIRGFSGGSPKSMLVYINSLLISILLVRLGLEYDILDIGVSAQFIIGIPIFVISALLHLTVGKLVYMIHMR